MIYTAMRTDDPARDYDAYMATEDGPTCELCGEPLGEHYYDVFETKCCEDCIRDMRRSVDHLLRS